MVSEGAKGSRRHSKTVSTTETLEVAPAQSERDEEGLPQCPTIAKDFGFVPIPARARHDPEHPAHFGLLMNIVFALASTFLIANIFYCQPILIQLSAAFGVTDQKVTRIPLLGQAGYAVGLLLILPLGDLVRRRPLILLLIAVTGSLTIGLAITSNVIVFEILCFLVGAASVTPQILLPLAVDLAPPERRATALSIVFSGVPLGVVIARVLAGVVAQFVSWRVVYYIAVGTQFGILLVLYWMLPDYPAKNKGETYFGIFSSMAKLTITEPLLVQAVLISTAAAATFSNWWVTLTFLLGGPPYNFSTLVISLFGLFALAGVVMAPLIGRIIDRSVPWSATLVGTFALTCTFAIQTAAVGLNVAVVIIVCIGFGVFRQTQQVSILAAVLSLDASARSRLNAVLALSMFIGQIIGTSVGSKVFLEHGWRANAALNLALAGWQLLVLLVRGPHCPRYTWLGWKGGFELRKGRVLARHQREREAAAETEASQGEQGLQAAEKQNREKRTAEPLDLGHA